MNTNKRIDERQMTMGLMSTVSDGNASYLGVVEDVSATGLRLSQVPAVFDDTAEHCLSVVKGPDSDLKILMRPCWAKATNRGMYKVIGFEIEDPSTPWKEFVDNVTSEAGAFHTFAAVENGIEM